jgi:hypothetical protein
MFPVTYQIESYAYSLRIDAIPAPEPRESLHANPTDPILSRLANPGLILPVRSNPSS